MPSPADSWAGPIVAAVSCVAGILATRGVVCVRRGRSPHFRSICLTALGSLSPMLFSILFREYERHPRFFLALHSTALLAPCHLGGVSGSSRCCRSSHPECTQRHTAEMPLDSTGCRRWTAADGPGGPGQGLEPPTRASAGHELPAGQLCPLRGSPSQGRQQRGHSGLRWFRSG